MHKIILVAAIVALAGCNKQEAAEPANDTNVAADADVAIDANAADAVAGTAMTSLNETSWEYTEDGKPMQLSVDATGNYITVSGTKHDDHGTAAMKNGKVCFTSAMNKDGEMCWTDPMLAEGQSGESTSDKGEKLTVKRTAYVPLTM
ncbi:MAG: hypothetical protein ABIO43_09650 [Sphingomicrobium sp.]